jgi:hypothetical protein
MRKPISVCYFTSRQATMAIVIGYDLHNEDKPFRAYLNVIKGDNELIDLMHVLNDGSRIALAPALVITQGNVLDRGPFDQAKKFASDNPDYKF